MQVLPIARPSAEAIDYATGLLARAKAGEVCEVVAVEFRPGGLYQVEGTPARNRLETAGALLEAAVARLGELGG